jgi:UDP-N-acetylglucosamine 2-epimerase (non-hydrolysing)
MKHSSLIITDSGGIQEEATAPGIRKRVLVIRLSTERQEAVEAGFAKIVGTDKDNILAAIHKELASEEKLPTVSPFGDGTAAEKTVDVLRKDFA